MVALPPPPNWLVPLPEAPPLDIAMQACVEVFRHHDAPTRVCRQCITEDMERRMILAAQLAQSGTEPAPEDFGQIYFEHPNCVGGEETVKLFAPFGIQSLLTGTPPPGFSPHSYPEVLETILKAGFWFWRPELFLPVRDLAARLFLDWFERGHYGLKGWPHSGEASDDLSGPGCDILHLCSACLIDPADLIERLSALHTPWADEELAYPGNSIPLPPFSMSVETGRKDGPYKTAADAITTALEVREAQAILRYTTPDWVTAAYFRREANYPELSKQLSELGNYYEVKMVDIVKAADKPILTDWPDLPFI